MVTLPAPTMGGVSQDLPAKRYRELLGALRDEYEAEHNKTRGWKAHAGRRLDISRSMISQIMSDDKGVGQDTIAKAVRKLRLPSAFFFDASFPTDAVLGSLGDSHLDPDHALPTEGALAEFLADFGDRFSPETLAALKSGVFGRRGMDTVGKILDMARQLEAVQAGDAEIIVRPKAKD